MTTRSGCTPTPSPERLQARVEQCIDHARALTHRFRKLKCWTCKQAGKASRLADSTISHWEVGRLSLSLEALLREALAVGVPLDRLFIDHVPSPLRDLIDKISLLSPEAQHHLSAMVDGLLTAELQRQAAQAAAQEVCA